MKIESFEAGLYATSSITKTMQRSEDATLLTQNKGQEDPGKALGFVENSSPKVVFSGEQDMPIEDQIKKRIIEHILGELTSDTKARLYPSENSKSTIDTTNPYNQARGSDAFAFSYNSTEEYYEKTTFDFSAQATIKTDRGEFNIDISLSYSSEFYYRNETSIEAFGSNGSQFGLDFGSQISSYESIRKSMSFEFDYARYEDRNTQSDIPKLQDGVGYIALDKNNNGEVDNAHELFGATGGDGFEELRAYDEDGNNWIDENDSVYQDLRIWEKGEDGKPSLVSLADSGVGAIYLGSVSVNPNGDEQASFYVKDNGEAGIVSNFDIKV